jgi:hypothetical protein
MVLNAFIRSSGLYDGVEDFDAATLDPSTGNMLAEFYRIARSLNPPGIISIPTTPAILLWAR